MELCCNCPLTGKSDILGQLPAPRANTQQPDKNVLVFDGLVTEAV